MKKILLCFTLLCSALLVLVACQESAKQSTSSTSNTRKLKALIVDGQNNHGIWPKTTAMMKDYLEQTGMFEVSIERTALTWQGPANDMDVDLDSVKRKKLLEQYTDGSDKQFQQLEKPASDSNFKPDFSQYDLVVSNFGWTAAAWPAESQRALEKFVSNGGGLLIIHAADNSFPEWPEFNKMIGMGAWGDRSEKDGPYVYYDNNNKLVRDTTAGPAGSHGKQYEFVISTRDTTHPITQGMPAQWLHAQDELYDRLRGPAENMNVLATAYSDQEKNTSPFSPLRGTNRHEPMMMVVDYGKGRVFHTPLGHTDYSMECVGFISTFQRAAEWAATGKVTQKIPGDFPTADKVSQRKWTK